MKPLRGLPGPANPERLFLWFLFLVLAVLTGGCTCFNRDWQAAAMEPIPANDLAGRWQGIWLSDVNGHTEQLRCLIRKVGGTNYSARFQAKYKKLIRFTFNYTAPLVVEQTDDAMRFQGEADLGWMGGGLYHYRGHADATNFFSTYSCKYDHGTFQMKRVTSHP